MTDSVRSSEAAPVGGSRPLPRLRPELEATPQIYDGEPYWVIKDPMSLRYYRFNREEYFIIEKLREGVTLDELKQAHRREFQDDSLSGEQVGHFIRSLLSRNLVMMPQPNRDELLYQSGQKRWRKKLANQFTNFMFFKIPLYDPDRLFNHVHPRIRWLWSKSFCLVYLALLFVAASLVMRRWGDFASMFHGSFFTLRNVPIMMVAVWLVKALHEFGHGLTCKNYGGEVHEMGFLFLVFTPFFYCNVTDSWVFPNKIHRLLVTAGGIMTEILFSCLAAMVWYFTDQPSFVHALAFNVVIACSVSTVLFNANPLLRYDGYYALMDILEVPNLRQRSSTFMRNWLIRTILGGQPEDLPEQHRFRVVFPLYSVAAYIYRWFILFVIMYAVYHLLEQMGLVWLARFLVLISAGTMLLLPLYKSSQMLVTQRRALGISNVRLLVLLAMIGAVLAFALFLPYEQTVTLNFILEPAQVQWVRADVDGRLHWNEAVVEGAWIGGPSEPGQLATLSNPELQLQVKKLQAEIAQLDLRIDQLKGAQATTASIQQLADRRSTQQRQLERLEKQMAALMVRAPFYGQVLTTQREIDQLEGRFLRWGEPLVLLGDTRSLTPKVWVPEKTWARIFREGKTLGQPVELMLYGFPEQTFEGRVASASSRAEIDMGPFNEKLALSNKVGGEVLTEYDPVAKKEKPLEAVYEVGISLADQASIPSGARPYMSGRVQIDCGKSTLYQWTRDSLLRFISPEIRL